MIYRDIAPRVRQAAPFLKYDRDPYLVVTDDGRLVWMLDAYTTTDRYPYAEPVRGIGNYIRNSVKATVDAYPRQRSPSTSPTPRIRSSAPTPRRSRACSGRSPRCPRTCRRTSATRRTSSRCRRKMYRDVPHGGSAGLLQQGRPLGHPAAAPGGPRQGDGAVLHGHAPARRAQGGVHPALALQPERARQHDRAPRRAIGSAPNYGRLIAYTLPEAEAGLRAPQHRRADQPGPGDLPADLPVEPAGQSRVLRGSALRDPHRRVADLRAAALPGRRARGRAAGAAPRGGRLRQPDRHGALPRGGARAHLRRARARRGAGRRGPPSARRRSGRRRPAAAIAPVVQRAWEAWQKGQEALRRGDWASLRTGAEAARGRPPTASGLEIARRGRRSAPSGLPRRPVAPVDIRRHSERQTRGGRRSSPERSDRRGPPPMLRFGRSGRGRCRGPRRRYWRSRPRGPAGSRSAWANASAIECTTQ